MQPVEKGAEGSPGSWIDRGFKISILAAASLVAVACAGDGSGGGSAITGCDRPSLLVTNARIPDHNAANSILIEDGAIAWIGVDTDAPPHDEVLDADGATALPGLVDSHAHFDALAAAKHLQAELHSAGDLFPITMRQTLASGVTTARVHLSALEDMALMHELSNDDCFPSPRIVSSGPGLLGGAPDVDARLMRGVKSPEDATAKIVELADRGAEWIALHGLTRFSAEERAAIFDAAATFSMKLMADTDDFANLERAIASPIRSGEYLNRSGTTAYPTALIEAINTRVDGLYVVPPVGYYLRTSEYAVSTGRRLDSSLFLFVDQDIAAQMVATFDTDFESDQYIGNIVSASSTFSRKFLQLRNSGATLVIGSDSGSLGQFHHDAIWQEMRAWRLLGAEPGEIVDAATNIAARMLDRNDIGRLSVGARGDVLLYDGKIFEGEFDRFRVEAVIKGGVIFVEDGQWTGPDTAAMRESIQRARDQLEAT